MKRKSTGPERSKGSGRVREITELPGAKDFSPANLRYMKRFYELFPASDESLPQLAEDSLVSSCNWTSAEEKRLVSASTQC